jgi:UDP-glucose 4-epimerase
MKILVTGGAGFIGSHLVEALVQNSDRVRVLDDFSTGREENLEDFRDRVELIRGDLRDEEILRKAVRGAGAILHQAALPSVPRSFADPIGTTAVNAGGTIKLLEAARRGGVKRFVFASSSSVYGDSASLLKNENLPPRPLSPYAVSKFSGECYCRLYWKNYGLATVSLRYFNVFGPRQDPESEYAAVIPKFITAVLRRENPVIYGDGLQTRDFTYIDNVVEANLKALVAPPGAGGGVFNVACGHSASILDLAEELERISGAGLKPRFEPPRPGDVKHSRAGIERAKELINYEPVVSFPEGLKSTYEYFKGINL